LARSSYVDAVFYSSSHWVVGETSVGDTAGSDHWPVVAQLGLK
jgi:endonuclease/exonuclease/phosphatase (EEP) superfamily protein YafD